MAASALLTLLSSPSPRQKREGSGWEPSQKRQKGNNAPGVAMRRAAASNKTSPRVKKEVVQSAQASALEAPDPKMTRPAVQQAVADAMGGQPEPAKLVEAERWLYRQVELVRGKYKGRFAAVVGMTAKKYRVRVNDVEHQLEFYPSMFKNPQPMDGLEGDAPTTQVSSPRTLASSCPERLEDEGKGGDRPGTPTTMVEEESPRALEHSSHSASLEGSSTGSVDDNISEGSSAGTLEPSTGSQVASGSRLPQVAVGVGCHR